MRRSKYTAFALLGWALGPTAVCDADNDAAGNGTANDARYFSDGVWYDYRSMLKQPVVLDLALAYEFANGILGVAEGMRVNFGLSNLTNKHTKRLETLADGPPLPRSQDDLVTIPQGRYDSRSRVYYVELLHTFP